MCMVTIAKDLWKPRKFCKIPHKFARVQRLGDFCERAVNGTH